MPIPTNNKYLQDLLETLITSYETEINYTPEVIQLDPKKITADDTETLLQFVSEPRKRLFIFKIPGDDENSAALTLSARRAVLDHTAKTILQSTSTEPKINPLKQALSSSSAAVRAGIQIQKSFALPKQQIITKEKQVEVTDQTPLPDLNLVAVQMPELPVLEKQLANLGIQFVHDEAAKKIVEYTHAFTDGIMPDNLPRGFYIDQNKHALCYTDKPPRLPSALAPALEKLAITALPTLAQTTALLPDTAPETPQKLLDTDNQAEKQTALLSALTTHKKEITSFLQSAKPEEQKFLLPMLAKLFILGGEAHTCLLARLLSTCKAKKISLDFLKDPVAREAFLSPHGIKNLQKLVKLPAEQRDWWNTLVLSHLDNNDHHLDFNAFFDAYTQIFLPAIAEKNLTLPNPCPIQHKGHMLTTLNRVLDVIEQAANPQEQCLTLAGLNWGPTGVHHAMTGAPKTERMKQVAACMALENPEDSNTNPEAVYLQLEDTAYSLTPWIFRYMGQHWKADIRLADINEQLEKINKPAALTAVEKNQLTFILGTTFSDKGALTAADWKLNLKVIIKKLLPLETADRAIILQALSRSVWFKPAPSLQQIQTLIEQCLALKQAFPDKNLKDELLMPFVSCLEQEGFEYLDILKERIEKTQAEPAEEQFALSALQSLTSVLQTYRKNLTPDIITMLATVNDAALSNIGIDELILALNKFQEKKGDAFTQVLSGLLGQINISKSQSLPKLEQIVSLINNLADSENTLPAELLTLEKQEWLKNLILDQNLLPGCVLGKGDISKLDGLIVDALVDMVKKRSAVLNIRAFKETLKGHLGNPMVPKQLKEQLDAELMPVFDALAELVELLQTPNPSFDDLVAKLHYFEEKKPVLLDGLYSLGLLLGQSKGEYLLSFLLTGKRKEGDIMTSATFASILGKVHDLIAGGINGFFNDQKNKASVKDLDAKTLFSWLATFNATHSILFLFKEELVEKKVLPALKKTLQQLNTQDPDFEKSILDAASKMDEEKPSDITLTEYKNKIEAIANYLNTLIDIKDKLPAAQFNKVYKQLQTGQLARFNYQQKQVFINKLLKANPDSLDLYLNLTANALENNAEADKNAIDRAINGLTALFDLSDLEPDTQTMFFKMSVAHNLKYPGPFPLAALNELKNSGLPEQTKAIVLKQIIQILSRMKDTDSPEHIQGMVQKIQAFLTQNPEHTTLCIELLKRISVDKLGEDLNAYQSILTDLASLQKDKRNNLAAILTGLATRTKDDTVNLPTLLEITKGLALRTPANVEQVLALFKTPPYPIAQALNSVLRPHDEKIIKTYCQNFDTNPFIKPGETRKLAEHFATNRIKDALTSLEDLMHDVKLPYALQMQLARQLTYIETLGYTDPLNPNDFTGLKKLTASSRYDLQERAMTLLQQMRTHSIPEAELEACQLELLANMREIYFRTTGLFPQTTQMLMLLLSLHSPDTNLLMSIKTGEGKSLITPMLAVLQWAQGGTVDVCTANRTLLRRDYENSCESFFTFLGIKSAVIQSDSKPEDYQLGGINCSTLEDMSLFRLAAKEAGLEARLQNDEPIHLVLDECDDALLDQTTLYKLVAETDASENPAQWIYPLAWQFVNLPAFRNSDADEGTVWDEEEDLEQFRMFLNKEISDKYQGDAYKQNFMMASSNTQLRQWINACCKAAKLVENKHFIVQPVIERDESGNETTKKMVCVPLIRSTPKGGCIFTDGVQQALQARLLAEHGEQNLNFPIDVDPAVLASQSASGLIQFYQNTRGRLVGISGTPGDTVELQYLSTTLGTQAIGVAPFAGDIRKKHPPVFTTSDGDTIAAIHRAIDSIKLPISKPLMEIDTVEPRTYEEIEAVLVRHNKALDKWNQTQTQPILLVCEDFEEAGKIEQSLAAYKQAGFTIQTVTGKESPMELERIIKQAGRANTITIGTAMLARGIDINPGNHPQGLFVIQAYADSDRINTQVAGRAARNGKPGQWTPIYQVQPPLSLWTRILCFFSPTYRQKTHQEAVAKLQAEIKLQDSVDRLYTKAIDKAQHTLMLQIKNWENLLLELFPGDSKLQYELYQWREDLLSELTQYQESAVSQETLDSSIKQFNSAITKLWETVREEKWAARAQKAGSITSEQTLRLKYLKQSDLMQECKIQDALQQQSEGFKAGTTALMQQNLDLMIQDKAGVVLSYTSPDDITKQTLKLAQSRQLLPNVIGEFCKLYPRTIKQLVPSNSTLHPSFTPEALNALIETIIQNKNQNQDNPVVKLYQQALAKADSLEIQALLTTMRPLIYNHARNVAKMPFIEQFKMRGLIVAFGKLYQDSGLPEDSNMNTLKTHYDNGIMKKVAHYLTHELKWVKETPRPLHALMERTVAIDAAVILYDLAQQIKADPLNVSKIHALYQALQEQRLILQDKYLFSMGHTSVRNVANLALTAFEILNTEPFCSKEFQDKCHDEVLSRHHLADFNACMKELSARYTNDPVWDHLQKTLETMRDRSVKSQTHIIEELHQAIERFSSYKAYQPYLRSLNTLKSQLTESLTVLKSADGLKQNSDNNLLAEKTAQFAGIFKVDANKVRIQSGSDGIRSYIDLQIKDAPALQEGFTGYQSASLNSFGNEKLQLSLLITNLKANEQALVDLSDEQACQILPPVRQVEFKKLFDFKALLDDWDANLNNPLIKELPAVILTILDNIQIVSQWDWTKNPVDLETLQEILGEDPEQAFLINLERQRELQAELDEIGDHQGKTSEAIDELNNQIDSMKQEIETLESRIITENLNLFTRMPVDYDISVLSRKIKNFEAEIVKLKDIQLQLLQKEGTCQNNLVQVNQRLDEARTGFMAKLTADAAICLKQYLPEASRKLFDAIQQELISADNLLETLTDSEMKKARYQTRRFFSTTELLQYEANLTTEEENILKPAASLVSSCGFFKNSKPASGPLPTPSLPGSLNPV